MDCGIANASLRELTIVLQNMPPVVSVTRVPVYPTKPKLKAYVVKYVLYYFVRWKLKSAGEHVLQGKVGISITIDPYIVHASPQTLQRSKDRKV